MKYSTDNYKGLTPFFLLVLPTCILSLLVPFNFTSKGRLNPFGWGTGTRVISKANNSVFQFIAHPFSVLANKILSPNLPTPPLPVLSIPILHHCIYLTFQVAFIQNGIAKHYNEGQRGDELWMEIGNVFAIAALYNFSLFLIPVSRGIYLMRGIATEETALAWHRISGVYCIVELFVHFLVHTVRYLNGEGDNKPGLWGWTFVTPKECWWTEGAVDVGFDCDDCSCYDLKRNAVGLYALIAMTLLAFLSVPSVRRRSYKLFYCSHVILAPTSFIFMCVHWNKMNMYLIPSLSVYMLSFSLRMWRYLTTRFLRTYTKVVKNESVGSKTRMLVVKRNSEESGFTPGQFVRIRTSKDLPILSPSHPFTVASKADDPHCTIFYLKGHSAFSKNLARAGNEDIKLTVEGYYGPTDRIDAIENLIGGGGDVVVVAGGIGITPYLSILSSLSPVEPGRVTLIWSTRDEAFASYLIESGWLATIADKNIAVNVHITQGGGSEGTEEESESLTDAKTSADDRRDEKRACHAEWVGGELGWASGLKTWAWEADNGLLGNLVTGLLFSMYLFASFMVTFEFWVKHQDKKVAWTRSYAILVVLGMAVVLGFILNSKVIQRLVWGRLREISKGERVRFRSSGGDDSHDSVGIELQNGRGGRRSWGKLNLEENRTRDEETGEGRDVNGVKLFEGRSSLSLVRELSHERKKVGGVFVCGPSSLINEVRAASSTKVVKCGANTTTDPQILSNCEVYEEVFEW